MGSASAHRVGSERVQLTVAELLGRCGQDPPARRPVTDTVPEGWPTPGGSARLQLALTAGSVLAAGSLLCTAALYGGQPHGGAVGSETTEGGHPVGAPSAPPAAPDQVAKIAEPRRQTVAPVVRTAQVRRATTGVARPARPAPVRRHRARPAPVPAREDTQPPAGSALSMLTRPVDSLLHVLG